jgi:hypothetical protein
MKNALLLLSLASFFSCSLPAQPADTTKPIFGYVVNRPRPARVDFDGYEKLMKAVKEHRKTHLVNLKDFLSMSKEPGVIILDTRSDSMFKLMHIKGAINLNFADFTQESLAKVIPSHKTKILIYCNNNFDGMPIAFPDKALKVSSVIRDFGDNLQVTDLTLALNIPTFINLYGYGYRNVHELSEMVTVYNSEQVEFEGTLVPEN